MTAERQLAVCRPTQTVAPNGIDPVRWRDYHGQAQLRAAE